MLLFGQWRSATCRCADDTEENLMLQETNELEVSDLAVATASAKGTARAQGSLRKLIYPIIPFEEKILLISKKLMRRVMRKSVCSEMLSLALN